jgi:sphingomyelin phosphodiesterase acid-like 3
MRKTRRAAALGGLAAICFWPVAFAVLAANAAAQTAPEQRKSSAPTVQALLVSDIHFDPFWDPAKAVKLAAAPIGEWSAILAEPASADREARFEQLQQACGTHGVDTPYALLESSLRAMRANARDAKFVLVSGDLIAHGFSCKFTALFPKAGQGEHRAFTEKTIGFVMRKLSGTLPGVPVYSSLGNNDSDCGDYRFDANSEFLASAGDEFTRGFPAADREKAIRTFATGGYYSVDLPAPFKTVRLLVLNDLFMSRRYETCSGKADPAPAAAEIVWLEERLGEARRNQEKVWVMAHIPPGVDPYSTAIKGDDICSGSAPKMFLLSEALPEVLAAYGDVIQLVLFGHTHMDELRLLKPAAANPTEKGVAVKLTPSISPINGNDPSFIVATIGAPSAVLEDYRVIVASNQTGVDAKWTEEYDFKQTYKEPAFTASAVADLIARFKADSQAEGSASQSYIRNFSAGTGAHVLALFWHPYVCGLENDEADAFRACVCGK